MARCRQSHERPAVQRKIDDLIVWPVTSASLRIGSNRIVAAGLCMLLVGLIVHQIDLYWTWNVRRGQVMESWVSERLHHFSFDSNPSL